MSTSGSIRFTAGESQAGLPIQIWLDATSGQPTYDNVRLTALSTADDHTPPAPDPMGWDTVPAAMPSNSISMRAASAMDVSGVQYFFTNTVDGHVSGWQDSSDWTENNLTPNATYNETGWSAGRSAQVDPWLVFSWDFEAPDLTDPRVTTSDNPAGWVTKEAHPAYVHVVREATNTFTTPYRSQALSIYDSAGTYSNSVTTSDTILTNVLKADITYTLSFNVCKAAGSADTEYHVEFLAGVTEFGWPPTTVLGVATGWVSTVDMSFSDRIVFEAPREHPALGKTLAIRLKKGLNAPSQTSPLYDNVQIRAVPVIPTGCILIVR
jgi:hypothetical protein